MPRDSGLPSDQDPGAVRPDAGCALCCEACLAWGCDPAFCEGRAPLVGGATLPLESTDGGGHGDCAVSASGFGGHVRYYGLTVPLAKRAVITARPPPGSGDALVRVFDGCAAGATLYSDRGGALTQGAASVCVEEEPVARDLVVAVSRYSGEPDLDLAFELGVELRDAGSPCR